MRKEGRKKREWGNTHTHIWVFLLLLSFWSGGLYSSGLLRPSRAREADLLMAAQLPPQLSVPFSLFSWLFWSLLHSFILWLFLSLSSLLTSSPFFHHYLPAHERLAVRTRLRKDLADSRWKTVGNGNQNLIRTKAATPETTRNFEFRIFFLNIYLFFSLALTYRYITDVYRTRHIGMPALFSQFPADLKLKQIPNSNKQIVKRKRRGKRFIWSVREPAVKRRNPGVDCGGISWFIPMRSVCVFVCCVASTHPSFLWIPRIFSFRFFRCFIIFTSFCKLFN